MPTKKYNTEVQIKIMRLLIRDEWPEVANARATLLEDIISYPEKGIDSDESVPSSLRNLVTLPEGHRGSVEVIHGIQAWAIALPDEVHKVIWAAEQVWKECKIWEKADGSLLSEGFLVGCLRVANLKTSGEIDGALMSFLCVFLTQLAKTSNKIIWTPGMSGYLSQELASFITCAWVQNNPIMVTRLAHLSNLTTIILAQIKNLPNKVVCTDGENSLLCNKVVDDIMAKLFLSAPTADKVRLMHWGLKMKAEPAN